MGCQTFDALLLRHSGPSFHTGDDQGLGDTGQVYSRFNDAAAPKQALTPGQLS